MQLSPSPQPQFDAEDLIDRMMGNEELARRIVGVFLEDVPLQLLALQQALATHDATASSRIAHSIRGAASNAGGESLVELARGIEQASNEGQFDQVSELVPQLEDRFVQLKPLLEEFCR
jgi:HPt (histidine-containing phosphotransfer) domain-containing protein